jgi:hypothetical protein
MNPPRMRSVRERNGKPVTGINIRDIASKRWSAVDTQKEGKYETKLKDGCLALSIVADICAPFQHAGKICRQGF